MNTTKKFDEVTVYGIAVLATMLICMAMLVITGITTVKGMNNNSTITIDAETVNIYIVDTETFSISEAEAE